MLFGMQTEDYEKKKRIKAVIEQEISLERDANMLIALSWSYAYNVCFTPTSPSSCKGISSNKPFADTYLLAVINCQEDRSSSPGIGGNFVSIYKGRGQSPDVSDIHRSICCQSCKYVSLICSTMMILGGSKFPFSSAIRECEK